MKKKFILAAAVLFILSGAAAIHSAVSAAAPSYGQEMTAITTITTTVTTAVGNRA